MKKLFTLAMLAVGMLFTTSAQAQGVKFGVKAGLNVSDMKFDSDVISKSNQAGFFIGPTVKFTLPVVGLGVDASLLYEQRSAKISLAGIETFGEKEMQQKQLILPVNLRYSIGLGSMANVFFFAGPQFGVNIGDEGFEWTNKSNYQLKKTNLSVNIGAGATLLGHLQVTANYNIACGKTGEFNLYDTTTSTLSNLVGGKTRNNSWQVGVAYFF
ncbi:MAG: porin family protein [Prevotella sp.]|nr:porin family protein [Prevotella sp.]MDD7273875.1 porin family protein [Prevotellaceae bacterium]MDY3936055.1 porin family protein [Prevotella sp.]MDY4218545.1 porin family protein [Prevotella sp.]